MHKVLVIDDDDRIRQLLTKYLSDNNYVVKQAENAKVAKDLINNDQFDLIVMDVMMPGESGINLTSELKSHKDFQNIPILMLSALSEPENRVSGLEIGADDYLTKPFEPKELLLRLNKLIKRRVSHDKVKFGDFTFNINSKKLYKKDQLISLTSTESNLLYMFAKQVNQSVHRKVLSEAFFGVEERSIDVQIARLRSKIEEDPKNPKYLRTDRNIGYGLYIE